MKNFGLIVNVIITTSFNLMFSSFTKMAFSEEDKDVTNSSDNTSRTEQKDF